MADPLRLALNTFCYQWEVNRKKNAHKNAPQKRTCKLTLSMTWIQSHKDSCRRYGI